MVVFIEWYKHRKSSGGNLKDLTREWSNEQPPLKGQFKLYVNTVLSNDA